MAEEVPDKTAVAGSTVLRLRGLPFQATEEDIKDFFSGYDLQQIFICRRGGRATGEAYVQASSLTEAGEALKSLNRKHMGRRYIEIFEASESDLNAVKALSGENKIKGFVVRMRGLPYSATEAEVVKFFDGLEVAKGGVVFTYTPDGRPTGEAYVEFPTEEMQKEAMQKHKEVIGSRYIELFLSTRADMYQAMQQTRFNLSQATLARQRWLQQGRLNMPGIMQDANALRLSGLPGVYGSQGVDDVTDLISGFNLGPRGGQYGPRPEQAAHLSADNRGLPTNGAAFGSAAPAYRQQPANQVRGAGTQGPVGVPTPVQPVQQVVSAHDYQLAQQQQQLLMQQHYLMQQQLLQQQQPMRYDAPWATVAAVGTLGSVPQQVAAVGGGSAPWLKPYTGDIQGSTPGKPLEIL